MNGLVRWAIALLAWLGCTGAGWFLGALFVVFFSESDADVFFVGWIRAALGGIFGSLAGVLVAILVLRALPKPPE